LDTKTTDNVAVWFQKEFVKCRTALPDTGDAVVVAATAMEKQELKTKR